MKTYSQFLHTLFEASYKGNLGIMELVKFNKMASDNQKKQLKDHILNRRHTKARELIHTVTGTRLHPIV
jgi:hypothetical protein